MPEHWWDIAYCDYLIMVDDVLDDNGHESSTEEEMAMIAECQEADESPEVCAEGIVKLREEES